LPTTPALVHVSVVPPAGPATMSVPLHITPVAIVLPVNVNVPENDVAVVLPPTVPLLATVPSVVCHVPLIDAPFWAIVIVTVWLA